MYLHENCYFLLKLMHYVGNIYITVINCHYTTLHIGMHVYTAEKYFVFAGQHYDLCSSYNIQTCMPILIASEIDYLDEERIRSLGGVISRWVDPVPSYCGVDMLSRNGDSCEAFSYFLVRHESVTLCNVWK